jgi:histone-lysine N-methyltransferase SETD3
VGELDDHILRQTVLLVADVLSSTSFYLLCATCAQGPALKLLAGVAAVALTRFSTSLDHDLDLLAGKAPAAGAKPDDSTAPGGAQPAAGGAGGSSPAPLPLTPEMRLALEFRVEKKKLLSRVIQALGERLQQLPSLPGLPATTAPSSPAKGTKPAPATVRGFGAAGSSKSGKP